MKKVIKKTKKNVSKEKIIVGVLGIALILGVTVAFIFSNRNKENDTIQKLESNQELVYGKITEINGNEITYTVCTISDGTIQDIDIDVRESEEMSGRLDASIKDSQGGEIRERPDASIEDSEGGEIRERPDASIEDNESGEIRERPDASIKDSESGEILGSLDAEESEFGAREISNESGGETDSLDGEDVSQSRGTGIASGDVESGSSATSTISYFETDKTITILIPVGTTVTTKLGTITTFSRLTAGDVIEIVLEELSDGSLVIVSIEIVE